jgi:hypothetical protein
MFLPSLQDGNGTRFRLKKGVYSLTRRSQRLLATLVRTSCHRPNVKIGVEEQCQLNLLAEGAEIGLP